MSRSDKIYFDKEGLKNLYFVDNLTIIEITHKFNVCDATVFKAFKEFNIKVCELIADNFRNNKE